MSRRLALPLVFAAAILALYYVTVLNPSVNPFSGPGSSGGDAAGLAQRYDPLTLAFADPDLGYSIRYPRGYPLETVDGQSALFYATAPDGNTETFAWSVLNGTSLLPADLQSEAEALGATLESSRTLSPFPNALYRLTYRLPALPDGSGARLIQGYRTCGGYALYLAATVPDTLSDDASLADYALYTSECGPPRESTTTALASEIPG